MKRALLCSLLAAIFALSGCGKDSENNGSENNGTNNGTTNSSTNNETGGTNSDDNNDTPVPGDCEWGAFLATCGGGPERDISGRAVGCREYYEPSPPELVQQADLCDGEIWDEMAPCSNTGLSGRRPLGCCFEVDTETSLYTRHCYYDDPASVEMSAATAEQICTDAGFCWVPPEMM